MAKEEEQLKLASGSPPVSTVNAVKGAVGPTLTIELNVGVNVTAIVDTASNSTIISRSLLHDVKRQLDSESKPMPKLELPCVPLYGKELRANLLILLPNYFYLIVVMGAKSRFPHLYNQKVSSV